MVKGRVEWSIGAGKFGFVNVQIRPSIKGNPYFFADGPFGRTYAFTVQENGDIVAKPKSAKRGAWKKVGQLRESFNGVTYWLGSDDELCDVEKRDLNNPMAQAWRLEHEALTRGDTE